MGNAESRKFGRYRLVGTMAEGAMARLFLAVMSGPGAGGEPREGAPTDSDAGLDGFRRVVVVKQVLPHLAQSPEFVHMFLNEARVAARLDHPGVVHIYEMGEIAGQYFISLEYLPGEDLTRVLHRAHREKQLIPVMAAARIAQCVADALQCAHELKDDHGQPLGLVHRDVSLGNVLVTYHGTVKLADFGIAKATALASAISTGVGVFKGKYAYAAPEQVSGKDVDARTDVFSLGVVLWELLALRRLFKRATDVATIHAVEKFEMPPLDLFRGDVPRALEAIAQKALAKRPRDRFQSAAEMSDALEELLGKVSARSSALLIKSWMVDLFGTDRAELKRAIAQGRGFEVRGADPDDVGLSPEKLALLGLKPLPDPERAGPGAVGEPAGRIGRPGSPTPSDRALMPRPPRPTSTPRPPPRSDLVLEPGGDRPERDAVRAAERAGLAAVTTPRLLAGAPSLSALERAPTATAPRLIAGPIPAGALERSTSAPARPLAMPLSGLSGEPRPEPTWTIGRTSWSFESAPTADMPYDPEATWGAASKSASFDQERAQAARALRRSVIVGTGVALLIVLASMGILVHQRGLPGPLAELEVTSVPGGAAISVDGVPTGLVTPALLRELPPDRPITVQVEKDGFAVGRVEARLAAGEHRAESVSLSRLSHVRFERIPAGAILVIDGRAFDPKVAADLAPGAHQIALEKDGAVILSRSIVVTDGPQVVALDP